MNVASLRVDSMNNRNRLLRGAFATALAASFSLQSDYRHQSARAQTAAPSAAALGTAATASPELADRFETLANMTIGSHKPSSATAHLMAALMEGAARLNPTEPRYLRMLYDIRIQSNDSSGAISALTKYLTLVPDDQYAQAKLINLYVSKIQTVEGILGYLRGVVGKAALPGPIRAHAAVVCAQTLLDHAQKKEALKMLTTALAIDPLSNAALKMKYRLSHDEGPSRRCGLLLAMLRSNPLDPDAATAVADELAEVGLAEGSAVWYAQAANLYQYTGTSRSPEVGRGGATELYLCGHAADAASVIGGYLASVPSDSDAWSIRLAIAKDVGSDPAAYADLARRAVTGVTNRLQGIRTQLGAANATTQPSDAAGSDAGASAPVVTTLAGLNTSAATQPAAPPEVTSSDPPDLTGDMDLLVKRNDIQLTDAYIAAAGDLTWMRLYFMRDAGDGTQRLLDGLNKLLPADDLLAARLNGWSYLVLGKYAEARQKLSAIADRDPYAALGVVLLDDQGGKKSDGDALARSSLAAHPSGAPAAVLYSAFRLRGAKVIPVGQADAVKAEVDAFPQDWFGVVTQPQAFFTVVAAPLATSVNYGQAMLARITVQNYGKFDITMGDDGILRPDMVFDASARGLVEKQIHGAFADRFWQRLVLPHGQSATQVVRLDRGPVSDLLGMKPEVPIDIQFSVITNPVSTKQGYVPAGAGYLTPFTQLAERDATPVNSPDDLKALYKAIEGGAPAARLTAAETAATFGMLARALASGANAENQMAASTDLLTHARQAQADADPAVRAWTRYVFVAALSPDAQTPAVQALTSSDDWFARLLGVAAAQRLPDHGQLAASLLSSDQDPTVKEYATAVSDYLAQDAAAGQQQPAPANP